MNRRNHNNRRMNIEKLENRVLPSSFLNVIASLATATVARPNIDDDVPAFVGSSTSGVLVMEGCSTCRQLARAPFSSVSSRPTSTSESITGAASARGLISQATSPHSHLQDATTTSNFTFHNADHIPLIIKPASQDLTTSNFAFHSDARIPYFIKPNAQGPQGLAPAPLSGSTCYRGDSSDISARDAVFTQDGASLPSAANAPITNLTIGATPNDVVGSTITAITLRPPMLRPAMRPTASGD